jgi:hypothetical protein
MNRNTKIALIVAGVIALGVGAYYLLSKRDTKSGNTEKDDKKILIQRTN